MSREHPIDPERQDFIALDELEQILNSKLESLTKILYVAPSDETQLHTLVASDLGLDPNLINVRYTSDRTISISPRGDSKYLLVSLPAKLLSPPWIEAFNLPKGTNHRVESTTSAAVLETIPDPFANAGREAQRYLIEEENKRQKRYKIQTGPFANTWFQVQKLGEVEQR